VDRLEDGHPEAAVDEDPVALVQPHARRKHAQSTLAASKSPQVADVGPGGGRGIFVPVTREGTERLAHLRGGGEPRRRRGMDRPGDDRLDGGRHPLGDQFATGAGDARRGEHRRQQHPGGEDVLAAIGRVAPAALGGDVEFRDQGGGERRKPLAVVLEGGGAEVGEHGLLEAGGGHLEQHRLGGQSTMDEAGIVDGLEPFEDMTREGGRLLDGHGGILGQRHGHAAATDVLIGDVGDPLGREPGVQQRVEAGVADGAHQPGLAEEAVEDDRVR
jgi:hypothetical protein